MPFFRNEVFNLENKCKVLETPMKHHLFDSLNHVLYSCLKNAIF